MIGYADGCFKRETKKTMFPFAHLYKAWWLLPGEEVRSTKNIHIAKIQERERN
jgi:hypothetical protein